MLFYTNRRYSLLFLIPFGIELILEGDEHYLGKDIIPRLLPLIRRDEHIGTIVLIEDVEKFEAYGAMLLAEQIVSAHVPYGAMAVYIR